MEKVKMNIEELGQAVVEEIKTRFPEADVDINEVRKVNDVLLHGVTIRDDKESGIYPTIYIDQYFEKYQEDKMTVAEIADEVIRLTDSHKDDVVVDTSIFKDFSLVKDKLLIKLVNTEKNQEMLKKVPHKEFLDLSVIYQILAVEDGEGIGTATINYAMMAMYGIKEEELHELAVKNAEKLNPAMIQSMYDVLCDMGMCIGEDELPDVGMIVVTNERKLNGASVVLYEDTLERIAQKYKLNKFYVLPSSIHEVLAVKFNNELEVEELRSMVREINGKEVAPDEVLSENVYLYNAETKELVVA